MEYKGIKQNWKTIDKYVRVDYLGGSFKVCEVLVDMPYPATKEQGKAHLQLIESAPKMMNALEKMVTIYHITLQFSLPYYYVKLHVKNNTN